MLKLGVNIDHVATLRNARANAVELAAVERFDLRHAPPPQAATVAANLMRALLPLIASQLGDPPRTLIE